MEQAVQTALMNNRSLAAARYVVAGAHGRLLQAGRLPNPELEFTGLTDVVFGAKGEGAFTIGLSQKFPVTSRLSLSREIRRVEVAQSLREIRNAERLLIARVQSLYIRAIAAELRAGAAEAARKAAEESVVLSGERIARGQGTVAESGLARVDERRWWNEVMSAKTAAETALLELKTELGLKADAKLRLVESLADAVASLRRRPLKAAVRPDAELALLEIDRAGLEVRLSRAEAWEGIRIGMEYVYENGVDEPEGLNTDQFLGLKITIPLPVWDQNRGTIAEREARHQETLAKVRAIKLEVQNSITIASRKAALLERQLNAYRSEAESVLSGTETELSDAFKLGRVDLRDLLQVRAQAANLRLESISLQEGLALALAELQAAGGSHPAISKPYVEIPSPRKTRNKHP